MSVFVSFVRVVDRLNEVVGRAVAWLVIAMVLITFAVVVMRYVYSFGFVWLQESYVWLHGITFMLGAGYTLLHNAHVRVDVYYRPGGQRYKALVDLIGVFVLLLPMIVVVTWVAVPYVEASWVKLEASREAGGLPGLFLLKSVILGFCLLVGLQGLSLAAHSYLVLTGHPEFAGKDEELEPL